MDLSPLLDAMGVASPPRPRALQRALSRALTRHAEHEGPAGDLEVLAPCGCLGVMLASWLAEGRAPLAAAGDEEGARVDPALPPVTDAHVHVFPDPLFAAIWRWFERYGWPVRYQLRAPEVVSFLLARGVSRLVLLHYAHKPGIARQMNAFVADLTRSHPGLVGLATVLPGEPDAVHVVEEAARLGLRGVKLHCHVQSFAPDADAAAPVFDAAARLSLPVVIHAGREPKSPAYPVDTYAVCAAERVERVLTTWPSLRLCVPHFGADEIDAYERLVERHANLYLDTTMILGGLFPVEEPRLLRARPDRVLFGTDFPNLPYAWDRELVALTRLGLSDEDLARVLSGTAAELFPAAAQGSAQQRNPVE